MQLSFYGPAALAGATGSNAVFSSYYDVSAYEVLSFQAQAYAVDAGVTLTIQPQHTNDPTQDDLWESLGSTVVVGGVSGGNSLFDAETVTRSAAATGIMSYVRVKITQEGGSGTYLVHGNASNA